MSISPSVSFTVSVGRKRRRGEFESYRSVRWDQRVTSRRRSFTLGEYDHGFHGRFSFKRQKPPSARLMDRQPFGRTAPLVNKQMWRNIIGISTYQLIVCITLMFAGTSIMDMDCPIVDGHEDCRRQTLGVERLHL